MKNNSHILTIMMQTGCSLEWQQSKHRVFCKWKCFKGHIVFRFFPSNVTTLWQLLLTQLISSWVMSIWRSILWNVLYSFHVIFAFKFGIKWKCSFDSRMEKWSSNYTLFWMLFCWLPIRQCRDLGFKDINSWQITIYTNK